ncbi:bromodomain-containing protein 4A isoform X2 [Galendromus occidentalis]|uniref:Bromodomain-containing protein 4A isoform X2 n=1 Tax=Galendromus occidentalis TaxID=34638 RepID=A0AAJ6QM37_9ACAR|nr:bromodomain-containing protein 4A isoform X2 [Galendromus occidentalis]
MAKVFFVLAWLVILAEAAPVAEKSQQTFLEDASSVVDEDLKTLVAPIKKKVDISITKDIVKKPLVAPPLPAVVPPLPAVVPPLPAVVPATPAPPHAHGHHHHAAPAPAKLVLDDSPVLIGNETVTGLLQQLLLGNIKNVQAHGLPLKVPPAGKPVAVIFSSAMHVVDLGTLQAAVKTHLVTAAAAHKHPLHKHPAHPPINHTSILESILQPLISLAHKKGHSVATVPVAGQIQPYIVMLPVAKPGLPPPADPAAQLEGLIQGLLKAKKQILAHQHAHHALAATTAPPPKVVLDAVAAPPPVPVVPVQKVKKIHISLTKNVG